MSSDCRYFALSPFLAKEYNICSTYIASDEFLQSIKLGMMRYANQLNSRNTGKVLFIPVSMVEGINEYCAKHSLSYTDLINISLFTILKNPDEFTMLVQKKVRNEEINLKRENNVQVSFRLNQSEYEELRQLSKEKNISIRTFFLFALLHTIGEIEI